MTSRRFLLAVVAVLAVQAVVAGTLQVTLVDAAFGDPALFRPEGQERLVPYFVSRVLFAGLFVFIFTRGFGGRGAAEGVRYGLLIWLFYVIPMTVGFWAFLELPDGLAGAWVGVGLAEMLAGGLVLGLIHRPTRPSRGGDLLESIRAEYERYRALAEGAFEQLDRDELCRRPPGGGNAVSTLAWHISGNLESRFTDFLTSDGEKPWRDREAEFEPRDVSRDELLEKWSRGWEVLFDALDALDDRDLGRTVTIRGVELTVARALHRSLAHTAGHVGQILYRAMELRADAWRYLSIPPGGTEAYNRNPTREKGPDLKGMRTHTREEEEG